MTAKEKRAGLIGGLVFVGLGIAAILNPDLMDGGDASGRNVLIKWLIILLWSRPFGCIAILLGCGSIWNVFKPANNGQKAPSPTEPEGAESVPVPVMQEELRNGAAEEDDRKWAPPGYFD